MKLVTVMYHYIRDVSGKDFPTLKALGVDDFCKQVRNLSSLYEFATLRTALDFLSGRYKPNKDLCFLTFDDGFIEHYEIVTPVLTDYGIEGVFFLPTAPIEEGKVLPVHQNHFLMAYHGFDKFKRIFFKTMQEKFPTIDAHVSEAAAIATYRWDNPEVAKFKYLINYHLSKETRNELLSEIFLFSFGNEEKFSCGLYINWQQAREMVDAGMLIGGHSHSHRVMSECSYEEQRFEIKTCKECFDRNLKPQDLWPFSYPYGKTDTYTLDTIQLLKNFGFDCSFSTTVNSGMSGCNLYEIPRIDTKDV